MRKFWIKAAVASFAFAAFFAVTGAQKADAAVEHSKVTNETATEMDIYLTDDGTGRDGDGNPGKAEDGDLTIELQNALDGYKGGDVAGATSMDTTAVGWLAPHSMGTDNGQLVVITIAPGSYTISSNMAVYPNTKIIMDGVTLKYTKGDNAAMFRLKRGSSTYAARAWSDVSGYNAGGNITFDGGTNGGTLNGNGGGACLLRFGHSDGLTFNNLTLTNVKNAHHMELGGCTNVAVTNCIFSDFHGSWTSSTNYEALQLEICHEGHFSSYGLNDETPCTNVTITGCEFKNVQRGVGTHSAVKGIYSTGINISNNTFTNIFGYAITGMNYQGATISGNTIKNCGSGILFRSMDASYTNFYNGSGAIVNNASSTISGNYIQVNQLTMDGMTYKNVAYGIQLYGEKLSAAKSGIKAGDYRLSGVTVSGNTIDLNVTGYGIWLQGTKNSTLDGNTVNTNLIAQSKGTNGDAIRLQKSPNNTISNTTITNAMRTGKAKKMIGITIQEKSNNTTISGTNTITNTALYGIAVRNSTDVAISGCTITKPGTYGVYAKSSEGINISKNNFTTDIDSAVKGNGDAIRVEGSASAVISGNTITNKKTSGKAKLMIGICVIGSSDKAKINNNKIYNASKYGICVRNAKKVKIVGNIVKKTGSHGVMLDKKATVTKYQKNKITKTKGDKIHTSNGASYKK